MRVRVASSFVEFNGSLCEIRTRTMGVDGATILGDGSVASVIDLPDILRDYDANSQLCGRKSEAVVAARLLLCLIVDDSVSVRRTMEQMLQDTGYDVAPACAGHAAKTHT